MVFWGGKSGKWADHEGELSVLMKRESCSPLPTSEDTARFKKQGLSNSTPVPRWPWISQSLRMTERWTLAINPAVLALCSSNPASSRGETIPGSGPLRVSWIFYSIEQNWPACWSQNRTYRGGWPLQHFPKSTSPPYRQVIFFTMCLYFPFNFLAKAPFFPLSWLYSWTASHFIFQCLLNYDERSFLKIQ